MRVAKIQSRDHKNCGKKEGEEIGRGVPLEEEGYNEKETGMEGSEGEDEEDDDEEEVVAAAAETGGNEREAEGEEAAKEGECSSCGGEESGKVTRVGR